MNKEVDSLARSYRSENMEKLRKIHWWEIKHINEVATVNK